MCNEHLNDILQDKALIRSYLEMTDMWPLEDIVLFSFGYDHKNADWNQIDNKFPARQYNTALEATTDTNPKTQLLYIEKRSAVENKTRCFVKKGTFFKWAIKKWPDEPRLQKMYALYQQYKNNQQGTAQSAQTNRGIIRQFAKQRQIELFKEHCQSNSPETFHVNINKIARQCKKEIPNISPSLKIRTIYRYIDRIPNEELMRICKNSLN